MGQLDRGLKWAGDWEGSRAYGGRGMAGYKNLGGYKDLEGDILTGACEGHEYGTGQGLRG